MLLQVILELVDRDGRARVHPARLLLVDEGEEGALERPERGLVAGSLLQSDRGLDGFFCAEELPLGDVPVLDLENAAPGQVEERRREGRRRHGPPFPHQGLDERRGLAGRKFANVIRQALEPVILADRRPAPVQRPGRA